MANVPAGRTLDPSAPTAASSPQPSHAQPDHGPLRVEPTTPPPFAHPLNTDIASGFLRAIKSIQGAIPAAWGDQQEVARTLAASVPRLTVARLIVWCRENKQPLEVVAAKVLTDALSTEPGLMELTPHEAAEEGVALIQSLWPKGALMQRQPPPPPIPTTHDDHPVLARLRDLGEKWHRLAALPANQAKQESPTAWRAQVINHIARAKADGLRDGLSRDRMMAALEAAGDRWVWEIPPPAREYSLDEFGVPPTSADMDLAAVMPA